MFEDAASFQVFGLNVYIYGLFLSAGIAVWLLAASLLGRRKALPGGTILLYGTLALPIGLVFARLFYCLIDMAYFQETISQPAAMLYFWDGGYSMFGAITGAALAGLLAAKIKKIPFGRLMDVLAVPAGIFLAAARLGEQYTALGRGRSILNGWMRGQPFFGVQDAWSNDVFHAVFRYEAVVSVLVLAAMLILFSAKKISAVSREGDLALVFGALFGACQVVLESLRDDGHLLWGFVRASQVFSILLPVAAIGIFGTRLIRGKGWSWHPAAAWIAAAGCIAIGIIKEFDIDTSDNLLRDYFLMSLAIAGLAAVALWLWHLLRKRVYLR